MRDWIYYKLYRALMILAHKYDWHYAPESGPLWAGPCDPRHGSYQKWCQWCGLRYSYHKHYATYIMGKEAMFAVDLGGQDSTVGNSKT